MHKLNIKVNFAQAKLCKNESSFHKKLVCKSNSLQNKGKFVKIKVRGQKYKVCRNKSLQKQM